MESYKTINQTGIAEFKDRGSRFIAQAFPFENPGDFKKIFNNIRKEHPKAAHHCFAYRSGLEGNFRSGDDGEPAGTAGKQILGQIDSAGLTDILIVVVRYFGGTLLGIPGLIHAYKTSASLVLQLVPFIEKKVLKNYILQFDYTQLNTVIRILKQYECVIYKQEALLFYNIEAGIPISSVNFVKEKISNLHNVEMNISL